MKYFTKQELIRCYCESKQRRCKECRLTQAIRRAPNSVDANIEALVNNVLDPAREAFGQPIIVNSGFRCPLHNTTVGGVRQSQHIQGEAADISFRLTHSTGSGQAYGLQDGLMTLARIIVSQGKFDQLILYPTFLHVSYKRNGDNRHNVLRKTPNGYEELRSLDAYGLHLSN